MIENYDIFLMQRIFYLLQDGSVLKLYKEPTKKDYFGSSRSARGECQCNKSDSTPGLRPGKPVAYSYGLR